MEKTNKSELLYNRLYQRIMGMADGSPLPTMRQLMAEYEVSQATVAPAIAQLKMRGLLESFPRQGLFVRRKTGNPSMLLLQPDWVSASNNEIQEHLRVISTAHAFQLSVEYYDYRIDICESLNKYEADVIVLNSICDDQLTPLQVMRLTQCAVPVILCGHAVSVSQIHYVCGDNSAGGALAAHYLASCGHRRIGLLYCEPHLQNTEDLSRNFRSIAENSGCQVTLLDCEMRPGDTPNAKIREFAGRYARNEYDFSALFAVSDHGAVIALQEFETIGVRVPSDLSILGFGNVTMEPGCERLTTIDTPRKQIATEVVRMAGNLISRREAFPAQLSIVPALVERGSVMSFAEESVALKA